MDAYDIGLIPSAKRRDPELTASPTAGAARSPRCCPGGSSAPARTRARPATGSSSLPLQTTALLPCWPGRFRDVNAGGDGPSPPCLASHLLQIFVHEQDRHRPLA